MALQSFSESLALSVEFACYALEVTDPKKPISMESAISKGEQMQQERIEWTARREAGESLRQIAEDEGVEPSTVMRRCKNEPEVNKCNTQKDKNTRQFGWMPVDPVNAAAKIREKFGAEFSGQLRAALPR